MRTTIELDDRIFRAFKERAASRGSTFAHEVEEALRSELHARTAAEEERPFEMPTFEGEGGTLIDIENREAIQDLIDEEDRAGGRW